MLFSNCIISTRRGGGQKVYRFGSGGRVGSIRFGGDIGAGPVRERGQVVSRLWTVAAFRTAMVFCGMIVFLGQTKNVVLWLMLIVHIPKLIIELVNFGAAPGIYQMSYNAWCHSVAGLIRIALAGYLLAGAPHFVRWHVKKTLEMCGEKGENG